MQFKHYVDLQIMDIASSVKKYQIKRNNALYNKYIYIRDKIYVFSNGKVKNKIRRFIY